MDHVQEYLRGGGTLASLKEELAIRVREHQQLPGLFSFTYHQIDTPKDHPVAKTCRGIVLDASADWAVVCRPFDRFFGHEEAVADPIDWDNARAYVKEDGSLLSMYHHAGAWHVSTKGTPDASGKSAVGKRSFAQLFWRTFKELNYTLPGPEHRERTFIFELCTPANRVVVPHTEARLPLIGVRERQSGAEQDPWDFETLYRPVAHRPVRSAEELLHDLADKDPLHHEGFVVCDTQFRRVKVKHPGYFDLHLLKIQALKPRTLLAMQLKGTAASFVADFPEFKAPLTSVQARLSELEDELDAHYAAIQDIEDKKRFALAAQATGARLPGVLFRLRAAERSGHPSTAKQILSGFSAPKLAKVLGLRTND